MTKYTAKDIKAVSGIEHVRLRPAMYIGDTGERGFHHLLWEILDNAVDEAMAGYAKNIKVTLLSKKVVSVEDDGRGIPVDIHPQLKKPAVEVIFTHLGAGGKFSKDVYKYSGGLHGVGSTVVCALSKWLEVVVKRDGKIYKQRFEKGKAVTPLEIIGKCSKKETGTKVTFEPDDEIFEINEFDPQKIEKRIKSLAYLNPGIKFVFEDKVRNVKKEFLFKEGIKELVKELNEGKELLFNDVIYLKGEEKGVIVEVAFQYNKGYNEIIESFVNNIKTPGHGTHVTGFKTGFTKAINTILKSSKVDKALKQGFSYEDLKEGLVLVVSAKVPNPQFEGQTKDKLGNTEVKTIAEKIVYDNLIKIFNKNKAIVKAIAEKAWEAKKAREAAKKAKQLVRRKSFLDNLALPGKLTDCIEKDNTKTELFIVEGDSAGGTAKQARDKRTQAVLPLRGKILNIEKSNLSKILSNEEIKTLVQAIGTGIGKDFNKENLRYGKIIIMTDADVDGSHIRALLLTFFYRFMRPLIEEGHIYVALPPLYRLKKGKEVIYVLDDKEMQKIKKELIKKNLNVSELIISDAFELEELLEKYKHLNKKILKTLLESKDIKEFKEKLNENKIKFKENEELGIIEVEGFNIYYEDVNSLVLERAREVYERLKKQMPLKIKYKNEEIELKEPIELAQELSKWALKDYEIQRYKGLGEMNVEQLWETTINPETRQIKRITIEDAAEADKIIEMLMGEKVDKRREFIFEYAYKANLDV